MKSRLTVIFVGLAVLTTAVPALPGQQTGPEALIGQARAIALTPHFSRQEITQALIMVLDASLLVLPETSFSAEFKDRVGTVRKMFADGALFEDKARQYLGLAYKLVAGGQAWAVPEDLKSAYRESEIMDRAKKICIALLDGALAEIRADRREEAVRNLISFAIFVITPVEA